MGARILVIEDNQTNLELMNYLLRAFGHHTLSARDGHEGLAAARRELPDLIICDIDLPKLNGLEVAKQLKSESPCSWIPLIAVTAFAMVGDRDRVMAAGFDGYIPKPIVPEKFVAQVEAYLPLIERSSLQVETQTTHVVERQDPAHGSVLVVDNLAINIELMRSLLEPSGYCVFGCDNVDEGLEMARQATIDLIISDVHMPEKDGYAFIQAVRSDPQLRNIPFMFLSSTLGREFDIRRGTAFGADRFITRPIEPKSLLAEVEALISGTDR